MTLHGLFAGETVFAASGKDAAKLFNLCMKEKIPYGKTAWDGENFLIFCAGRACTRLETACTREGITLVVRRRRGLPRVFERLHGRFGLLGGLLCVVFLLVMSRQVIWDIRIDGNDRLGEERILNLLAENGVEVGRALSGLDTDATEGKILIAEPDLSWISLNVRGTTVRVEVRETERGGKKAGGAANLVALCDGQIEQIEAYDGNVVVKKGDVVRKGELLVSGVYDTRAGSVLRMVRASGAVYARTVHEFCVKIPLSYEKKVYTGREWSEKTIKFFAKEIKVFANTGKAAPTCDIIYYENMWSFFGGEPLPVGMLTASFREYTLTSETLEPALAAEYAFRRMALQLSGLSAEAELLEKTFSFELTDTEYILNCRAVCMENIAAVQEIEIEP